MSVQQDATKYLVASCWTIIDDDSRCTDPWTKKKINIYPCFSAKLH